MKDNKPIWQSQMSTGTAVIFWGGLIAAFIAFQVWLSYSSPKPHTAEMIKSNPPAQTSVAPELPVTNTMDVRGGYLVVTTKVDNTLSYSIDKRLHLYVVDSTGVERFLDMVYVKLEPGKTGGSDTSKKLSDIGPPPYKITYEWK